MTASAILSQPKLCSKCGAARPIEEYPTRDGVPYGRVCRACIRIAQNARRANRLGLQDKHSLALRNQTLRAIGQQECRVCAQVLALDMFRLKGGKPALRCTPCTNTETREAYRANKGGFRDRMQAHGRKRRETQAPRLNAQKKLYVASNRSKVTQRQNNWSKAKVASDPMYALKKRIRSLIGNAFASIGSSKNKETQAILGCSFDAFRLHIERQFTPGMSWERMGREIHIDHILPLATAACVQDVLALNHFTNLRPMWATENIRKGAKVLALL